MPSKRACDCNENLGFAALALPCGSHISLCSRLQWCKSLLSVPHTCPAPSASSCSNNMCCEGDRRRLATATVCIHASVPILLWLSLLPYPIGNQGIQFLGMHSRLSGAVLPPEGFLPHLAVIAFCPFFTLSSPPLDVQAFRAFLKVDSFPSFGTVITQAV